MFRLGCQHVTQTAQNEVISVLLSFLVFEHSDFRVYLCASKQYLPCFLISCNCNEICVRHNTFKVQNLSDLS